MEYDCGGDLHVAPALVASEVAESNSPLPCELRSSLHYCDCRIPVYGDFQAWKLNGMTAESQLSYQIQIQRDKFKVLQMILHQTPKASAAVYLSSVIGGESTPIWSEDCGNMLKPPQIAGPWQLRILYSNVEQLHPFLYWILHIAGTCHWPYGDYPR